MHYAFLQLHAPKTMPRFLISFPGLPKFQTISLPLPSPSLSPPQPQFEKAAASLKSDGVILANIDATAKENEPLAKKFKVQGYPTLFIFRNNDAEKAIEYEGPRDAAGIVSYLKRQTGPASKLVADADAVKALLDSETAVIGVFPGGEKSAEYKAYSEAANALRGDLELAHVTDGKLLGEHWDNGKVAKVFVFKTFDEPKLALDVTGKSKAADVRPSPLPLY